MILFRKKLADRECTQPQMKYMKGIYLLIPIFLMSSQSLVSRPYQTGHKNITFTDPSRDGRKISAEVYYPSDIAGKAVPFPREAGEKFPVLCFAHGYLLPWNIYRYIGDTLVPRGYIAAFLKTEREMFPSHTDLAKDIAFVLEAIGALGKDPASFFYNRVDSMNCAMGHSMGGGSAVLAAGFSAQVRAVVALAPMDTWPSSADAARLLDIPVLIFSGENDCITPPESHQRPIYANLKSRDKTIITIKGGSHCQMADKSVICELGEATCKPDPEITREAQHAVILKYLMDWLDYELKGKQEALENFDRHIATDPSIEYQRAR